MAPLLIVFSGPSGVGKDSLLHRLLQLEPRVRKVPTVTTRAPRPGEVEGRDHYFVSFERFRELIGEGALLEHASVYGNWYGVPRADVDRLEREGWDVALRTDIQGAASVKALEPRAVSIFISPADLADLKMRLEKRGVSDPDDLALRLENAGREMDAAARFDHVVINPEDGLDLAVENVRRILEDERARA